MAITASTVTFIPFQGSALGQGIFPSTFNFFAPWIQSLAPPIFAPNTPMMGCHKPTKDVPRLRAHRRASAKKPRDRHTTGSVRPAKTATRKSRYYVTDDKPITIPNDFPCDAGVHLGRPARALKREDSFILVDHGSHFKMVKPGYARKHYQRTPNKIESIAGYHAFAPVNVDRPADIARLAKSLRGVLVESDSTNPGKGIKRVRFEQDEDEPEVPRIKRARATPIP